MSAEAPLLDALPVPPVIDALQADLAGQGGQVWLVGGGVRDHLLGEPVKDIDVEVHRVAPNELERALHRLGHVNAVGRSFGVFKLRPHGAPSSVEIDISLPRRDSNHGPGHRGIRVEGDPFMGLDEAVRRRDLTINALMVDVATRRLVDRVGGYADLRAGLLREVDPQTFLDDPLRALRVVQFAARTGFQPTDSLRALCRNAPLAELPAERVQAEWEKLLLRGSDLAHGMRVARALDILARVFPEVTDSPETDDVLQRALAHREALDGRGPKWALMMALWLAASPAEAVVPTLDRLALYTMGRYRVRDQILALHTHRDASVTTDTDLRRLAVHVELRLALAVRACLQPAPNWAERLERATQLGVHIRPPAPLLQGRDLATIGMRGGPAMGALLKRAYEAQLDGALCTYDEAMAWARDQL